MKTDKILHFAWSAFLTYGAIAIIEPFINSDYWGKVIGCIIGLGIGLIKEYKIDKHPSRGDIIADVLGCLMGAGLSVIFTIFVK